MFNIQAMTQLFLQIKKKNFEPDYRSRMNFFILQIRDPRFQISLPQYTLP